MLTGDAARDDAALAEAFATVLERGGETGLDTLLGEIVAQARRRCAPSSTGSAATRRLRGAVRGVRLRAAATTPPTIAAAVWPLPGLRAGLFRRHSPRRAIGTRRRSGASRTCCRRARRGVRARPIRCGGCELLARGLPEGGRRALRRRPGLHARRCIGAHPGPAGAVSRRAGERSCAVSGPAGAVPHAGGDARGADHRRLADRPLRAAEGGARLPRLQRPDHPHRAAAGARSDVGAWVQYKLDQGIDHILLDEAQDTSPDQWSVVRGWPRSSSPALGARDNVSRTIFAVGDEKQSIYSFQGAAPESFAETGRAFSRKRVATPAAGFERVRLHAAPSARPRTCCAPSTASLPATRRGAGLTHDERSDRAPTHPRRRAGLCRALAVDRRRRGRGAGRLDASAIDHATAPAVRARRDRSPRRSATGCGTARCIEGKRARALARRRRPGAGAQARPLRPCAVAQPEEPRRAGRRRRPAEPVRPHRGART